MTKSTRNTSVLCVGLALAISAVGCAAEEDYDDPDDPDASSDHNTLRPKAAARKKIMRAIHAALDPKLGGQRNEYVVKWVRYDGEAAFVQATVQRPGGGDLDWTQTDFASDVAEGLFDGPRLEALVINDKGTFTAPYVTVGATDAGWPYLGRRYPIANCKILPSGGGANGDDCRDVVEADAPTRAALEAAVRSEFLDAELHGQRYQLDLANHVIKVDGRYSFVKSNILGDIDWNNTEYADEIAAGTFDGERLTALFQLKEGKWKRLEHAVGPTDVSWFGAWNRHGDDIMCGIFPTLHCAEDE